MLDLFQVPFKGFEPSDFAVYTSDKWSSRLHNRARMGVRDKLNAFARSLRPALEQRGLSFSVETNDPLPSVFNNHCVDAQWLFFTRDDAARKELATIIDREQSIAQNLMNAGHHKRHLNLAVKVFEGGVDVMMGLHHSAWVDVKNCLHKLQDAWGEEQLTELLDAMSPEAREQLHLVGPRGVESLLDVTAPVFVQHLEALGGEQEWVIIGRNFPADDPIVKEEGFMGAVQSLLEELVPLYAFLLWSRDNDFLELQQQLKTEKALKRRDGVTLEEGDSVRINAGLFSGKNGVVQSVDKKGMVKVMVGAMVIQVKGSSLQGL